MKNKLVKIDSYGCVNWQPEDLPEGETLESLEEKRQVLVDTFSAEGHRGADRGRVDELMKITYICQRHSINASPAPTISVLPENWPFLFTQRWLGTHFSMLTGVELESRLSEALNNKGRRILHFFKSQLTKWKKEVRSVLKEISQDGRQDDHDTAGLAAILVMMAHFKESEDSLFLRADVSIFQGCQVMILHILYCEGV